MHTGPDLSAYGVDPVFKSGTDLYNNDLDNEADTVSFYNCSTLGYNATYNIPNSDTSLTVRPPVLACCMLHSFAPASVLPLHLLCHVHTIPLLLDFVHVLLFMTTPKLGA